MESVRRVIEALDKLAGKADRLVPLILSLAVLAAVVVIGMQGGGK